MVSAGLKFSLKLLELLNLDVGEVQHVEFEERLLVHLFRLVQVREEPVQHPVRENPEPSVGRREVTE